jgi:iron complex transport system ATP-binding protein
MMDNAIDIRNLSFSYGENNILNNLSLNIKKNKFYSIIGPNGSGKTTLLKNIAGILQGSKNSIYIDNKAVEEYKIKEFAKKVACVHQNVYIDAEFTAHEIVLMGRAPYKGRFAAESNEDIEAARGAMEITDTWRLRDKPINRLSGGEQQRVIAARAIAQKAEIILLDEPVSHMDIHHQIELLSTMRSLKDRVTIVAVLHDLNLAALYSDYIILLNKGKVEDLGTPEVVLNKKNLKNVYDLDVEIINDPVNDRPHIIPVINKKEYKEQHIS